VFSPEVRWSDGASLAGPDLLAVEKDDIGQALTACGVFDLSVGATLALVTYLPRQIFRPEAFGTIFGALCAVMAVASGLGPIVASLVHNKTGSYAPLFWAGLFWAGLLSMAIAGAILLTLHPRRARPLTVAPALP
jgi:hypothetical protein